MRQSEILISNPHTPTAASEENYCVVTPRRGSTSFQQSRRDCLTSTKASKERVHARYALLAVLPALCLGSILDELRQRVPEIMV